MLIVITGPSGVGKTTIINSLLKAEPKLRYSVSLTTRKPRPSEVDGVDYRFISSKEFLERVNNDEFAEWSEVYGKYYGRLKSDLDELSYSGDVVLGIDVQGALKLLKIYPEGVFIFILPKSESALESQLRNRGTDDEDTIRKRLNAAVKELDMAGYFEYQIINNKVCTSVKEIQSILNTTKKETT